MNMCTESGGVNPSSSDMDVHMTSSATAENEMVREAPPPYSPRRPGSGVITEQPIVHQTLIMQIPLKSNPVYYTCHKCMERVLTKVKHINSQKTHLTVGFICGCTVWCFMCCLGLIPYFVKTFKKTEHYCPNCDTLLGTYSMI